MIQTNLQNMVHVAKYHDPNLDDICLFSPVSNWMICNFRICVLYHSYLDGYVSSKSGWYVQRGYCYIVPDLK